MIKINIPQDIKVVDQGTQAMGRTMTENLIITYYEFESFKDLETVFMLNFLDFKMAKMKTKVIGTKILIWLKSQI
tara:strand:+ start:1297 stop:1521 length:225 start_codon:yes stop_codon:yes gene_type:complete